MYTVPTGACNFEAISSSECPKNVMNVTGFSECSLGMDHNELCEAKTTLPDGNTNYNINSCGEYDVFKCVKGIISIKYCANVSSSNIYCYSIY